MKVSHRLLLAWTLVLVVASAGGGRAAAVAAAQAPFPLTVTGGQITGQGGARTVLLRGVNVNALVDYPTRHQEAVPVGAEDFAEMRALGFDFVRLPVSLSLLLPSPHTVSAAYLERIGQVVDEAAHAGMWVLIDLHQDRYSKVLDPTHEADGFPAWMVPDFGLSEKPILFGKTTLAIQAAFTAFWFNLTIHGEHMWSAYAQGLSALARHFAHQPAVVGYDLMNEPNPGFIPESDFLAHHLLPFYQAMIRALRKADPRALAFVEPDVIGDLGLSHPAVWSQLHGTKGLVYAPHMYQGVFTPAFTSTPPRGQALWDGKIASLAGAYRNASLVAREMGAALLVGEFGIRPSPVGDRWIEDQVRLQNRYRIGSAFWVWKISPSFYDWGVVDLSGKLRAHTRRAQILAWPHPLWVRGRLTQVHFDPATATARFAYEATSGGTSRFYLSSLTWPSGFTVSTSAPHTLSWHRFVLPGADLRWAVLTVEAPAGATVQVTVRPR